MEVRGLSGNYMTIKGYFGLLLLLGMALLSFRQSLVWQSEMSLWAQAVAVSPQSPRPRINLGLELQQRGRYPEALAQYQEAVRLSWDKRRLPSHQAISMAGASNNIAALLMTAGRFEESRSLSDLVLKDWPRMPEALVNRGTANLALGNCAGAIADYKLAYEVAGVKSGLPKCQ